VLADLNVALLNMVFNVEAAEGFINIDDVDKENILLKLSKAWMTKESRSTML
jgi:hypothetical protein